MDKLLILWFAAYTLILVKGQDPVSAVIPFGSFDALRETRLPPGANQGISANFQEEGEG